MRLNASYVPRVLRLTLLALGIVEVILVSASLCRHRGSATMPASRCSQKRRLNLDHLREPVGNG